MGENIIKKVFTIDEIFGVNNVKIQAKIADNGCTGCYFQKEVYPYCFKPAYVGDCKVDGIGLIFKEIKDCIMIREGTKELPPIIQGTCSCDNVQHINIIDRTPVLKGFWEVDDKLSQDIILSMKIATLYLVAKEYPGKTIENIIQQLEARKKEG